MSAADDTDWISAAGAPRSTFPVVPPRRSEPSPFPAPEPPPIPAPLPEPSPFPAEPGQPAPEPPPAEPFPNPLPRPLPPDEPIPGHPRREPPEPSPSPLPRPLPPQEPIPADPVPVPEEPIPGHPSPDPLPRPEDPAGPGPHPEPGPAPAEPAPSDAEPVVQDQAPVVGTDVVEATVEPVVEAPAAEPAAEVKAQAPSASGNRQVLFGVTPPVSPDLGPTGRPVRPRPEPAPLTAHGPARIISMCNQKGGVGKTTSTINLGAALAEYGRKVLLVDLDPQGALSAGLGVASHELDQTIYNLMLERHTSITDVLVPTKIEGMDLIPANIDLSAAEVQLISEVGREQTLARALRPVLHAYDYILIDCQPSLGLLTVNALACSHGVIMPVAAEFFSLRGVALLVDTIEKVQERINPDLTVDGVLVTMFDGRTVHARDVVAMLVQRFGDDVYDTVVARTVKFPETTVAGEPITTYAPTSAAAQAFRALAREVIAS